MFYSPNIYDNRVTRGTSAQAGRILDMGPRGYRDPRQLGTPLGSGAVPSLLAQSLESASQVFESQDAAGFPPIQMPAYPIFPSLSFDPWNFPSASAYPPPIIPPLDSRAAPLEGAFDIPPQQTPLEAFYQFLEATHDPQLPGKARRPADVEGSLFHRTPDATAVPPVIGSLITADPSMAVRSIITGVTPVIGSNGNPIIGLKSNYRNIRRRANGTWEFEDDAVKFVTISGKIGADPVVWTITGATEAP